MIYYSLLFSSDFVFKSKEDIGGEIRYVIKYTAEDYSMKLYDSRGYEYPYNYKGMNQEN